MNPCLYRWHKDPVRHCACSVSEIKSYKSKIFGPLWDRFDIQVDVSRLSPDELTKNVKAETSKKILKMVERAKNIQIERYRNTKIFNNAFLTHGS
jgi:magnesium chelatase family protein